MKGVYLLVDKENGERYVGSATGPKASGGRFHAYAETGHGGNVELKSRGRRPYRVSVLQIGTFDHDILQAEAAWKTKLMTRPRQCTRDAASGQPAGAVEAAASVLLIGAWTAF